MIKEGKEITTMSAMKNIVARAEVEEEFTQEPEAISKITRTRDDGTKYVEIEYDDGSIETLEINIDEE